MTRLPFTSVLLYLSVRFTVVSAFFVIVAFPVFTVPFVSITYVDVDVIPSNVSVTVNFSPTAKFVNL